MDIIKKIEEDNITKENGSIMHLNPEDIIEIISNKGSYPVCHKINFLIDMEKWDLW